MKDDRFCALIQIFALAMMVANAFVGDMVFLIAWAVVGIWVGVTYRSTNL